MPDADLKLLLLVRSIYFNGLGENLGAELYISWQFTRAGKT